MKTEGGRVASAPRACLWLVLVPRGRCYSDARCLAGEMKSQRTYPVEQRSFPSVPSRLSSPAHHCQAQQTQETLISYVPSAGLHWAPIPPNMSRHLHHLRCFRLTFILATLLGLCQRSALHCLDLFSCVDIRHCLDQKIPLPQAQDCGYCNPAPAFGGKVGFYICVWIPRK